MASEEWASVAVLCFVDRGRLQDASLLCALGGLLCDVRENVRFDGPSFSLWSRGNSKGVFRSSIKDILWKSFFLNCQHVGFT